MQAAAERLEVSEGCAVVLREAETPHLELAGERVEARGVDRDGPPGDGLDLPDHHAPHDLGELSHRDEHGEQQAREAARDEDDRAASETHMPPMGRRIQGPCQ